jgi:hypothetical protein
VKNVVAGKSFVVYRAGTDHAALERDRLRAGVIEGASTPCHGDHKYDFRLTATEFF